MNVIGLARGLVLALVLSVPAAASVPPSPFAGVWYTRGQVVGSRLVIHSDGSWETRESSGRWTASGRRIEMDGNARGWCDGKGEIDDGGKVLTFACDRSWGRMTTIFDKWEEEPPTAAKPDSASKADPPGEPTPPKDDPKRGGGDDAKDGAPGKTHDEPLPALPPVSVFVPDFGRERGRALGVSACDGRLPEQYPSEEISRRTEWGEGWTGWWQGCRDALAKRPFVPRTAEERALLARHQQIWKGVERMFELVVFPAEGSTPPSGGAPAAPPAQEVTLTGSYDVAYQTGADACRGGALPRRYPSAASSSAAFEGWWDGCNDVHQASPVRPVGAQQVAAFRAHQARLARAERVIADRAQEVRETRRADDVRGDRAQDVRGDRAQDVRGDRAQDVRGDRADEVRRTDAQRVVPTRADRVKRTRADDVRPVGADDVKPVTGSDIAIDRAEDIAPVQAEPVRERRAQPVRPTRAQEVKPVRGSDIEEFQADEVKPSAPAEEVTLRRPDGGACTDAAPRGARFVGALRERTGDYKYVIEFAELPSSGRVTAHVTINAAEGRVMDGDVSGTVRDGAFTLSGIVQAWPYKWEHRLQGTVGADGLRARAATRGVGNAEWTMGELALPAVRGVDPATVGTWAMVVPGAAYTQEYDRGSWIERVNRASAGAAAGVLQVTADGAYVWKKRAGTERGRVTYCETPGGKRGWSVAYGGERFFLGYLDGQNGGFYLFSTRTGDYVYRGQLLK